MLLIDSHTHAVSGDQDRYPQRSLDLPNGAWWDGHDVSAGRLAAQVVASDVDAVVLVQAAGVYGDDNRYLADSVASAENVAGVCIVDPTRARAADRLRAIAVQSRIDGIRLFQVPTPNEPWLASPATSDLIDVAAEHGLTVTVCAMADALDDLGAQLARRPDVPIVLDHCGFANFSGPPPFDEAEPLWVLADHDNLHLKLTPTLIRLNRADPEAVVHHLVDRFGATRVLWGSDWPQHRETDTYAEQVQLVLSWFDGLPATARRDIVGQNALRLWPASWPHLRDAEENA